MIDCRDIIQVLCTRCVWRSPWESSSSSRGDTSRKKLKGMCKTIIKMYVSAHHASHPSSHPSIHPSVQHQHRKLTFLTVITSLRGGGGGVVHCAIEWLLVITHRRANCRERENFNLNFDLAKLHNSFSSAGPHFLMAQWGPADRTGQTTRHTRRPAYWVRPMMMHCTALADKKRMRRTSKPVAEIESIDRFLGTTTGGFLREINILTDWLMAWLDRQRKVSFIFSLSVHCLVQSQWPATGDKVSSRHLSSAACWTIDGRRRCLRSGHCMSRIESLSSGPRKLFTFYYVFCGSFHHKCISIRVTGLWPSSQCQLS